MRAFLSIVIAICLAALTGCANPPKVDERFVAALNAPYRLDSGDTLRIMVFDQPTLSNTYTVDNAGNISMPLIGDVTARGLTPQDLQSSLTSKLSAGFLRNPSVSVQVDAYRPFFILGEVGNPGQFPYVAGLTARNAIAIGGGFTARANQTMVEISRNYNGTLVQARVPLDHPIRPGDTVQVLERWF
ncbi:polysaccharide biosynthesis/export family protein [Microbaculum marinisediminis]|uniref:Polysaccharide export protein n=1 Tax=Microbaculum marinisediminis TaxID=2931392 RepID=A0AAW5QYD0_9HYPH|nr:polysaccharide biosynthesis/export family protein [Microbaculum sp. A6E488]MCT8973056.1 polysaccharide export protein [Microbaculum sp. A6E488]